MACITVDSRDPATAATFWKEALGWADVEVSSDGSWAVCRSSAHGTYLEFVRVPEAKVVKNRLHLGCTAGGLDRLDDEVARLVGLGATVAWEEHFPDHVAAVYRNVVLRDVEGNEFCVSGGELPGV